MVDYHILLTDESLPGTSIRTPPPQKMRLPALGHECKSCRKPLHYTTTGQIQDDPRGARWKCHQQLHEALLTQQTDGRTPYSSLVAVWAQLQPLKLQVQ